MHSEEKPRYQCKHCAKTFGESHNRRRHERGVHGNVKCVCDICGAVFSYRESVKLHLYGHAKYKSLKCTRCAVAFVSSSSLGQHMKLHRATNVARPIFHCDICGKKFESGKSLRQHEQQHSVERHQCGHCNRTFATMRYLAKHFKRMHVAYKPRHRCRQCSKTFSSLDAKKKHERNVHYSMEYKCDMCGVVLSRYNAMTSHLYRHVGYKPHKCPKCTMAFVSRKQLYFHKQYHEATIFHCDICGKLVMHLATIREHLKRHVAPVHT